MSLLRARKPKKIALKKGTYRYQYNPSTIRWRQSPIGRIVHHIRHIALCLSRGRMQLGRQRFTPIDPFRSFARLRRR